MWLQLHIGHTESTLHARLVVCSHLGEQFGARFLEGFCAKSRRQLQFHVLERFVRDGFGWRTLHGLLEQRIIHLKMIAEIIHLNFFLFSTMKNYYKT